MVTKKKINQTQICFFTICLCPSSNTGPILPSSLHAITTLLRPAQKGNFTAALYTHSPTAVLNVHTSKQQVIQHNAFIPVFIKSKDFNDNQNCSHQKEDPQSNDWGLGSWLFTTGEKSEGSHVCEEKASVSKQRWRLQLSPSYNNQDTNDLLLDWWCFLHVNKQVWLSNMWVYLQLFRLKSLGEETEDF